MPEERSRPQGGMTSYLLDQMRRGYRSVMESVGFDQTPPPPRPVKNAQAAYGDGYTMPETAPANQPGFRSREVAPGITAFGPTTGVGTGAQAVANTPPPYEDLVSGLAKQVSDPSNALTGAEFTPGGGVKLTGSYDAPQQLQVRPAPKTSDMAVQDPLPGYDSQVAKDMPVVADRVKNMAKKESWISDPAVRYILGAAAQAIAGNDTHDIGGRLGALGASLAQGQAYTEYLAELAAGKQPDEIKGARFDILPAEVRDQALRTFQNRTALEQQQQRVDIEAQRAAVYSDLARAQISGTMTAEQQALQKDLDRAIQLKIGEMRDRFLRVNETVVFDTFSGDILQFPGGDSSQAHLLGNLNAGRLEAWQKLTASRYLQMAKENYVQQLEEQGVEGARQASLIAAAFKTDTAGNPVNWQQVISLLTPEQRKAYAADLSELAMGYMGGQLEPFTFQRQIERDAEAVPGGGGARGKPKIGL